MHYSDRIRELRSEKGLLQKDIAKILNTSQKQYSRYETGTEMPYDALKIIANYYNTNIDYILDFTDERKPYPRKKAE